jgi:hypothetical protein
MNNTLNRQIYNFKKSKIYKTLLKCIHKSLFKIINRNKILIKDYD